jgi:hypothetical protein
MRCGNMVNSLSISEGIRKYFLISKPTSTISRLKVSVIIVQKYVLCLTGGSGNDIQISLNLL